MSDAFARPKSGYIPTLDGWRASAIVAVMFYHIGPNVFGPVVWKFQSMGVSGVELFFAISGFLICTKLLEEEERTGSISLPNFYIRRLFRIQPAAVVYLMAVAALSALGFIAFSRTGWITALLSVRNLYRSTDSVGAGWYSGHFWSLAIEEHFYLLMPWMLVSMRGQHRLRLFGLLTLVCLLANEIMQHTRIAKMTVSSEFELCWLFLAAWSALLIRKPAVENFVRRYLHAGPVLVFVGVIGIGTALGWRGIWHLWLPSMPLLVLATVSHPGSWTSRMLELPPMRWTGRISYSLYLWQQVFCIGLYVVPRASWPLGLAQHFPQCLAFSFLCAVLSYFLIEKPFVTLGRRFTRPSMTSAGAVRVAPFVG